MMATGTLLLDKKKNTLKIYNKYIKKIIIVLIVWSIIFLIPKTIIDYNEINISYFIDRLINGHYHFWYLYFLIGFYLLAPILNQIISNKKIEKYYLILWFGVYLCIINFIDFPILDKFYNIYKYLGFDFICNFFGYCILGHYLHNTKFTKKQLKIMYITGILSLLLIICGTYYFKIYNIGDHQYFYNLCSFTVFFTVTGIFCFLKEKFNNNKISKKIKLVIMKWSRLTFGVYIIHPLFIGFINNFGINILYNFNIFSILIYAVIIYLLSLGAIFVISKIPILNKYII